MPAAATETCSSPIPFESEALFRGSLVAPNFVQDAATVVASVGITSLKYNSSQIQRHQNREFTKLSAQKQLVVSVPIELPLRNPHMKMVK